jgi:hypothetical protein
VSPFSKGQGLADLQQPRFACLRMGTKDAPLIWNNEGLSNVYRIYFL